MGKEVGLRSALRESDLRLPVYTCTAMLREPPLLIASFQHFSLGVLKLLHARAAYYCSTALLLYGGCVEPAWFEQRRAKSGRVCQVQRPARGLGWPGSFHSSDNHCL
jgi:hypothetical protein